MSFHRPLLLLLLALPILHGFWLWVRRGRPLVVPFDHRPAADHRGWRRGAIAAETLVSLLLVVVVLLLAGPRQPAPPKGERVLNNIVFCLDVSGSMSAQVSAGVSRFDAAMKAIEAFCTHRTGDSFGLTIFGSEFLHWIPPTLELSAIRHAAPFLRPGRLPSWFGGTMIAKALDGCCDRLAATPEGDRALILVTDGASGDFDGTREREVARRLADARIRVYTILIGPGASPGVSYIAGATGGRVFQAADPSALAFVFQEIDRMQKAQFKPVASDWVEVTQPFCLAGLGCLGLFLLTQFGLRFTPW